ncbi:MAG: hypothetical protein AAF570_02885, partial [Bacteroidota bacterium]
VSFNSEFKQGDLRYDENGGILAVGLYENERVENMFMSIDSVDYRILFMRFDSVGNFLLSSMSPDPLHVTDVEVRLKALPGGYAAMLGGPLTFPNPTVDFRSVSMWGSSPGGASNVSGFIHLDADSNCVADTNLIYLTGMLRLQPSNLSAISAPPTGLFQMLAPIDSSILEISSLPPYWEETCPDTVHIDLLNNSSQTAEFTVRPIVNAPLLRVDVSAGLIRVCTSSQFAVHYANDGTETAYNAHIRLELDTRLTMQSSNLPWQMPQNGQVFEFIIDSIPMGSSGQFWFLAKPGCAHPIGANLGLQARISPDSFHLPPDPIWDGSDLEVDAVCNATADSIIFTVRNVGNNAMSTSGQVLVLEDNLMRQNFPVQLNANQDTTWKLPSNGQTWYILIDQQPGHPLSLFAADELEGCGTNALGDYHRGFAGQLPVNDDDYFRTHDRFDIIGPYDPNDKMGMPEGLDSLHYIEVGDKIEYRIRFQNTGNDTAFNVFLIDTLPPELDLTTLQVLGASHDMHYHLSGSRVLQFTFPNIQLPDSHVDFAGSQGYVRFRMHQVDSLPLGTVIENFADIYFDFNAPVRTNTYLHTIGEEFIGVVQVDGGESEAVEILAWPNPFMAQVRFRLKADGVGEDLRFVMYEVAGKKVMEKVIVGRNEWMIDGAQLKSGVYVFQVWRGNAQVGGGKLIRF